jgi:hypothetical protein
MKKLFSIIIFIHFLSINFSYSLNTIENAWEAFNENKSDQSRELFEKATAEADSSSADAYIGLILLATNAGKKDLAFEYLKLFFSRSSNPYPYFYVLCANDLLTPFSGKLTDDKISFLQKILSDTRANSTVKAIVNKKLGNHAFFKNDIEQSKKYFESINAIDKWQLVGEFDNTSSSGFYKNYEPILNSNNKKEFTNKEGAKVYWYTCPQIRNDKWVDFDFNFYFKNSIIYAQSFIYSAQEKDIILKAGVSGSLKIWLNDALIATEEEERNTDLDVYNYKTKLEAGYNRILIQIGESVADQSNFMLRITDINDLPVDNIKVVAEPQDYKKMGTIKSEKIPFFVEDYFIRKITNEPKNILYTYLLADVYLSNDKTKEARALLAELRKIAPKCSFLISQFINYYAREKNETELSRELEFLKSTDENSLFSIRYLLNESLKKEDYEEMKVLVDKMEKIFGKSETSVNYRLQIAGKENKIEDIYTITDDAYEQYPDILDFVLSKAVLQQQVGKNTKEAIRTIEKYLSEYYSEKAIFMLSALYNSIDSVNQAISLANKVISNKPYAIGYLFDLSKYYYGISKYNDAIVVLKQALQYAPYFNKYWSYLAKIYDAKKDTLNAVLALEKSITFNPRSYDDIKQIRKLTHKKDMYDFFQEVNTDEIANEKIIIKTTKEDNAIIIHNETQNILYKEGGSEEKKIIVVKVLTKQAIDNWKEYSVDYNPNTQRLIIEEAKIIKPSNNKINADVNDGYIVFTGLDTSDIIVLIYRIENYNFGKFANEFWNKDYINTVYPVQNGKVSYIVPTGKYFYYQFLNDNTKPYIKKLDKEYSLYTWELNNIPAIKAEPFMPTINEVGKILHTTTLPSWDSVASIYADMSSGKADNSYEITELVNKLLENKTKLNEIEKAKVLYEWIIKNIHYSHVPFRQTAFVPQTASITLSTKLGDCKDLATLYVAMSKQVGIKSNLVLVNTLDNGINDVLLPSLSFNHCIVMTILNGKPYYLELTNPYIPFGTQSPLTIKSPSLIIPNSNNVSMSGFSLLDITSDFNAIHRETFITMDNNNMNIKQKNNHIGFYAALRKMSFIELSKEERESALLNSISNSFTKPVKLNSVNFDALDNINDSIFSFYDYTVKNALTIVADMKIVEIPWTDAEKNPPFLTMDSRNYDINLLEIEDAMHTEETIIINIPDGKSLIEVPKTKNISFNNGDIIYSNEYLLENNKLIAKRKLHYNTNIVLKSNYEKLKDFFDMIVQEDHLQIGFKSSK